MRAAYDALDDEIKARIEGLRVHHTIAYSRRRWASSSRREADASRAPSIRWCGPAALGRRSLYVASHASTIVDWPMPEGRLLLRDLMEHATQREYVYRHGWRVGDLVIWDNRATMHRGSPTTTRSTGASCGG